MDPTKATQAIRPLGTRDFSFATSGGRYRPSVGNDALRQFCGQMPRGNHTKHIEIINQVYADCPVQRTGLNACRFTIYRGRVYLDGAHKWSRFLTDWANEKGSDDPGVVLDGVSLRRRHSASIPQADGSAARRGVIRAARENYMRCVAECDRTGLGCAGQSKYGHC